MRYPSSLCPRIFGLFMRSFIHNILINDQRKCFTGVSLVALECIIKEEERPLLEMQMSFAAASISFACILKKFTFEDF